EVAGKVIARVRLEHALDRPGATPEVRQLDEHWERPPERGRGDDVRHRADVDQEVARGIPRPPGSEDCLPHDNVHEERGTQGPSRGHPPRTWPPAGRRAETDTDQGADRSRAEVLRTGERDHSHRRMYQGRDGSSGQLSPSLFSEPRY